MASVSWLVLCFTYTNRTYKTYGDYRTYRSYKSHKTNVKISASKRILFLNSIGDLQRELPTPSGGLRARNPPEVCVGRSGVRRAEIDVVEQVERLGAEAGVDALGDVELFAQRKVPALLVVGAQAAEPQREGANVAGQLLRRVAIEAGVDVEPAINVALISVELEVLDVAGEYHIAETDRRPRLALYDEGDLPAADEGVGPVRQVVGELAPLAEGQFRDAAGRDAVRTVEAADGFVRHGIGRVQELDRFHQLRPGVCQLEGEPFGEAFLDLRLQRVIPRIADGLFDGHRAEGWERTQQLFARNIITEDRIQPAERVGELLRQRVDRRRVARGQRAQVTIRRRVVIALHRQ